VSSNGMVYVIDDDSALRDSLSFCSLLRGCRFVCRLGRGLPRGAAAACRGCILTDIRMQGLDVLSFVPPPRNRHGIPVIVMTGMATCRLPSRR